jgi:hypothetical protein
MLACLLLSTAAAAQPAVGSDGIPFAAPDAATVRVPSAADAWGGPRTGNEPTLSDRVVKYRIQATLDPVKHTVTGKQQLTWRNRSDRPVSAVYLHLYLNAFEGAGSTYATEQRERDFDFRSGEDTREGEWGWMRLTRVEQAGAKVPWRYVQPDGGPSTDRTVVRLDLPQPVAPGASTTLDIDFFDQLPRVVARTGYYGTFHLVAQWFPKIGVLELPGERGATAPRWNVHEFHLHSEFYADFGEYDVTLTVPKGYTVGATGELAGKPMERDGLVSHRYVQGDVHDFAWTADKRYAKPMLKTWQGPLGPVAVKVLYHPEFPNADVVMQATIDSLQYFSDTLGPYPYRTVTAVVPPYNADEAGGMEYPTFFTADSVMEAEPGTAGRFALDFVTIHEFGHGYFYGILASNEFEEPFLDEGLNQFWNERMLRARKQGLEIAPSWLRRLGVSISGSGFDVDRIGAMNDAPFDALGENSWNRHSSRSYGSVYSRTSTMLRSLEAQLGRETLERAFRAYYQRWKFRHPSAADLQQVLAETSGRPQLVARLFEQQVYGVHKLDDRIVQLESEEVLPQPGMVLHKGKLVEVTQAQLDTAVEEVRERWRKAHPDAKPDAGPFPYRTVVRLHRDGVAVPQTVLVRFADGSSRRVRWDDARRWAEFDFVTRSRAVSAELDPDHVRFLDANALDNGRAREANGAASRRWSADFAALLQILYALVVSL